MKSNDTGEAIKSTLGVFGYILKGGCLTLFLSCSMVVAIIGILYLAISYWPATPKDKMLAARGIPELPASAKIELWESGGWTATYLYAAASLTKAEFQEYSKALATRHAQFVPQKSGEESGEGIIRPDEPYTRPGWPGTGKLSPDRVLKGFYYYWNDGVDFWWVTFDEETRVVYIEWTHS